MWALWAPQLLGFLPSPVELRSCWVPWFPVVLSQPGRIPDPDLPSQDRGASCCQDPPFHQNSSCSVSPPPHFSCCCIGLSSSSQRNWSLGPHDGLEYPKQDLGGKDRACSGPFSRIDNSMQSGLMAEDSNFIDFVWVSSCWLWKRNFLGS